MYNRNVCCYLWFIYYNSVLLFSPATSIFSLLLSSLYASVSLSWLLPLYERIYCLGYNCCIPTFTSSNKSDVCTYSLINILPIDLNSLTALFLVILSTITCLHEWSVCCLVVTVLSIIMWSIKCWGMDLTNK